MARTNEDDFKHKAVVFNLGDPDQLEEYNHAMKRKNFSSYIKRLIRKDIDGGFSRVVVQQQVTPVEHEEELDMDNSLMKGFL